MLWLAIFVTTWFGVPILKLLPYGAALAVGKLFVLQSGSHVLLPWRNEPWPTALEASNQ